MNRKIIRSILLSILFTISTFIGAAIIAGVVTPPYLHHYNLGSEVKDINQEEECCGHVDVVPPSITLVFPLNNSIAAGSTNIDLYITDADSDINQVLYHWEEDQVNVTLDFPHDIMLLNETGIHILSVYAEDSAGNWISAEFVFTVPSLQTTTTTETTRVTSTQKTISQSTSGFEWVITLFVIDFLFILFFIFKKKQR